MNKENFSLYLIQRERRSCDTTPENYSSISTKNKKKFIYGVIEKRKFQALLCDH